MEIPDSVIFLFSYYIICGLNFINGGSNQLVELSFAKK